MTTADEHDDDHDGAGPAPTSYGEAVTELDQILRGLEDDDVDIDALAATLARAAQLIQFCRERVERAQVDIDRIMSTLDGSSGADN